MMLRAPEGKKFTVELEAEKKALSLFLNGKIDLEADEKIIAFNKKIVSLGYSEGQGLITTTMYAKKWGR